MDISIKKFKKYSDYRGDLVVFLSSHDVASRYKYFGQIYFVTFSKKGIIRGNHYHKQWREWFGVVKGSVSVALEDIRSKEQKKIILDANSKSYKRLEIGPYIAHAIKSLTSFAAVLNYADKPWRSDDVFDYKINI